MVDDILFRPDMNWLASSGAGDISTYGAPSDPTISVRAVEGQAPAPQPDAGARSTSVEALPVESPLGSPDSGTEPEASAFDSDMAPTALTPIAFASAQPSFAPTEPGTAEFARSSLIPIPAPTADPRGEFTPTNATTDQITASPLTSGPEALAPTVPILTIVPTALVDGLIAPLGFTAPAIDGILPEAASLVDTVLPGASSLIDSVLPDTGDLALPTLPLDAVSVQVDSLVDDATDLLGADPAGGIATLVSLVSVSDILDLRDAGGETEGPDSASAILDALAADLITADPLQAETERDDDDGFPVDAIGNAPVDTIEEVAAPLPPPIDPPVDDLLDGLGL